MRNPFRSLNKSILFLMALCFLFVLLLIFILFNIQVNRFSEVLKMERSASILYVVTEEDKPLLTVLIYYNSKTGKTAFLDIPENTGTIIPDGQESRVDRIDSLFNPDNPAPYLRKIEEITGYPVDFYLIQTADQLSKTVDLMEGITLFMAAPIQEKTALEWFLIPSGSIVLDGYKVGSFLRYTASLNDPDEAIRLEQLFVRSYFRRLGEMSSQLTRRTIYPHTHRQFSTNLDRKSLKNFLQILSRVDTDFSVFQYVRGIRRNVDGQILLFPFREGEILIDAVRQIQDYLARSDLETRGDIVISLEILNGTSTTGMASRTAQIYKSYGFAVSSVGNADRTDYDQTVVIDRKGNINSARKAAELIQCENVYTDPGANPDESVDVLVILGRDFDGRYVKK